MLTFFRKIRKELLGSGQARKYLLYAIGEIALVVLGILIALQINNWNENRMDQKAISNYFERIHEELQGGVEDIDNYLVITKPLIDLNRRTLEILNTKNPDSVNVLEETLGALGTSWSLVLKLPVTEEFLSQDYLSKINSDSIKIGFNQFTQMRKTQMDFSQATRDQYNHTIEPFFIQNINYSQVAMQLYRPLLIEGGPRNNYKDLLDNLELWNIVTFKLEALSNERLSLNHARNLLIWLDGKLVQELELMNDD